MYHLVNHIGKPASSGWARPVRVTDVLTRAAEAENDERSSALDPRGLTGTNGVHMSTLLIILIVIGVILAVVGGVAAKTLSFLLWIGIILAVIALIVWLVRFITGSRRV
jgi:Flp pilus assembly protein TadB